MKVDFSKPVQTRDGFPARILSTDRASVFCVVALVRYSDSENEAVHTYTIDGEFAAVGQCEKHPKDLVNVPVRIRKSVWLNLYNHKNIYACAHDSKESADHDAMWGRVACVEVKIDCEEGQGL